MRGNQIAVIFQEPMTALNPVYTVGFQIMEALRSHFDMNPEQAKERAIELLTKVEMPDPPTAFNKYPHQLSGGQRQRAMIAQSISCDPRAAHRRRADDGTGCHGAGRDPRAAAQPAQAARLARSS